MRKVLLVEDDLSLGETLMERLKKEYDVAWGKNLSEAWSLFSRARDFDLIILDVGLPDGSGFELAEKIKKVSPVLFLFLNLITLKNNIATAVKAAKPNQIIGIYSIANIYFSRKQKHGK